MLVSLVPTAIILAADVAGRDQDCRGPTAMTRAIVFDHEARFSAEAEQASVAIAPALDIEPRVERPRPRSC